MTFATSDSFSGSPKNQKAQKFGTKIITEEQFLDLMKDNGMNVEDL